MSSLSAAIQFFPATCAILPIVIVAYDTLLCFDREIDCIWRRSLTFASTIYVIQRYIALINNVVYFYSPTTLVSCKADVISGYILSVIVLFSTAAFTTLRVWAMYGNINWIVVLVFLCSMFDPCENIYNFTRPQTIYIDEFGCGSMSPVSLGNLPIVTRVISIVADIMVVLVTWTKTADVWRTSRRIPQFRPTLLTLLLRDGTMYFVALLILNIASLLLDVFPNASINNSGATNFIGISDAFANCLIARFILDLRSVYQKNAEAAQRTNPMSSVNFAVQSIQGVVTASVLGNMGAPLRTGEFCAAGETQDVYFSTEPFKYGLASEDEGSDGDTGEPKHFHSEDSAA